MTYLLFGGDVMICSSRERPLLFRVEKCGQVLCLSSESACFPCHRGERKGYADNILGTRYHFMQLWDGPYEAEARSSDDLRRWRTKVWIV